VKLAYEECSKRQQDLDFAESHGKTLNMKIKTRLITNINSNQKIIIIDDLYDIIYIDYDNKKQEMYFYLERVRQIA
jgi:SPP1 family predicted phage head-tail adaptor